MRISPSKFVQLKIEEEIAKYRSSGPRQEKAAPDPAQHANEEEGILSE